MKKPLKILTWVSCITFGGLFLAYADFWPLPGAPGELVEVGDRQVHVLCMGDADSQPAVWLEAPGHGFTVYWMPLQRMLENEGIASCSYDRSGFGWSEPYEGYDPEREVDEAIAALTRFDADGPIVLVGHSYGGLLVRVFAQRLSQRVRGIVYVDPATLTLWRRGMEMGEMHYEPPAGVPWPLVRLFMDLENKDVDESARLYRVMTSRSSFFRRLQQSNSSISEKAKILARYTVPDVPSVVISRSPDITVYSPVLDKIWLDSYRTEIGDAVSDIEFRTATDSGHDIPRTQPALIVDAIRRLIRIVETDAGGAPQPSGV